MLWRSCQPSFFHKVKHLLIFCIVLYLCTASTIEHETVAKTCPGETEAVSESEQEEIVLLQKTLDEFRTIVHTPPTSAGLRAPAHWEQPSKPTPSQAAMQLVTPIVGRFSTESLPVLPGVPKASAVQLNRHQVDGEAQSKDNHHLHHENNGPRDDENDEKSQERMYASLARPVPASVRDTIILTMLCLFIYSMLAVTLNFLELHEHHDDELTQDFMAHARVLQVRLKEGATIVKFLPLFACQFISLRLYVLTATNGDGEPAFWEKRIIDAMTGIILLRALCIFCLPARLLIHLSTAEVHDHGLDTDEFHVNQKWQKFAQSGYSERIISLAKFVQVLPSVLTVACLITQVAYLGVFARPSPTIIATNAVVAWCIVCFESHIWWEPSLYSTRESALFFERWRRSLLYGCRPLRKVPMFVALMLVNGMRAMQTNGGLQQNWAYAAMFTASAAIVLETLVCMYIGYWLLEVKDTVNDLFYAKIGRHLCAAVFFGGVAGTILGYFAIPSTAQAETNLSTTSEVTIMLSAVYYGVHIMQWLWVFTLDLTIHSETTVLETLLKLTLPSNVCLILAVLFVACDLQALQISAGRGAPQAYAQDCMRLCTLGVITQVVLTLCMQFLTGAAPDVAADGSPRFTKSPLALAYLASVVKWVSLATIHGGGIAVSISAFTITPKTALAASQHQGTDPMVQLARTVTVFIIIASLAFVFLSSAMLGLLVKFAIESVDRSILGVHIEVKAVRVSLWRGRLTINNLVVGNPENHTWRSDCLISVKSCIIEVSIRDLWHGRLEINLLALQSATVNFERPVNKWSNVKRVLRFLKGKKGEDEKTRKDKKEHEMVLHQLAVTEIQADLIISDIGDLFSIVTPEINYIDYAKETGNNSLSTADIVILVIVTLLNSILLNVGCRTYTKVAKRLCASFSSKKEHKPPKVQRVVEHKAVEYLFKGTHESSEHSRGY